MEAPVTLTPTVTVDRCAGSSELGYGRAALAIQLYAFPVVIIAGCLLNGLAVVVLQTRAYRGTSTGFLMTALSLADTGLLLTGILRLWILVLSEDAVDVRDLSVAGCKLHIFLTYVFQYVSAWTLALLTVERAICVRHPLRCKQLCSVRRIVIAWVVVVTGVVAINVQFLVTYDVAPDVSKSYCHGLPAFGEFLYHGAHNWIDLNLSCIGPFVVIIICNLIIVVTLLKDAAVRKSLGAASATQPLSSTTVMLLAVSTTFLVLMCPFAIYSLGVSFDYWPYDDKYECAKQDFVYYFTYLLFNLNSAVNFLLYYVSGTKFRKAMFAMVGSMDCASRQDANKTNTYDANSRPSLATKL